MNDLSDLQSHFVLARGPRVSVVLPLCDAEGDLANRIAEVLVEADDAQVNLCEIIAVDDDSLDQSWAVLLSLAAQEPRLRPIRLRAHVGLDAAREAGAMAATGDIIITLEPGARAADMGQFEAMIEAGYDVVTGLRGGRRTLPGLGLRDPVSGTAAFRRDAFNTLSHSGFSIAHVPFAAHRMGLRVGEVDVAGPGRPRDFAGLSGLLGAAPAILLSERLLGLSILAGIGLLAVALCMLAVAAVLGLGLAAVIGAVMLTAGVQITGMAMLGSLMIARAHSRGRVAARIAETPLGHGRRD